MRRSTALALIVGATLIVAASANAATVEVKYLLSSIEVFGAGIPLGPPGQGTWTVSYSSTETAPGTILPGPAQVLSFNLLRPRDFTDPIFGANLTGLFMTLGPQEPRPATLTAVGGDLMILTIPGVYTGISVLHCNGTPACTDAIVNLGLDATESVPNFNQYEFTLPGGGAAQGAPTAPIIQFGFNFAGVLPVEGTITGQEVRRTFVPTPTTFTPTSTTTTTTTTTKKVTTTTAANATKDTATKDIGRTKDDGSSKDAGSTKDSNPTKDIGRTKDGGSTKDNGRGKRVTICHVPAGKPANAHTIRVGEAAVPAHLAKYSSDYLGACKK